MTDLEKKAEEYCTKKICGWYDYCKDCINKNYRRIKDKCYPAKWVNQTYKDAYEQGQEDSLFVIQDLKKRQVLKENEELKKDKEYLDKVNNEQTEVILKLNEQIEKMKCCNNCKYNTVAGCNYCGNVTNCEDYQYWKLAE